MAPIWRRLAFNLRRQRDNPRRLRVSRRGRARTLLARLVRLGRAGQSVGGLRPRLSGRASRASLRPRVSPPVVWICVAWSALALLFAGIGSLAWRTLFGDEPRSLHGCFWLGWLGVVAFLQVWQLFFRIDTWTQLVLLSFAVAGWSGWARGRQRRPPARWSRETWLFAGLGLALVAWTAARSLAPPGNLDTCLYFVQTIRWMEAYPLVVGLGNLQHGLGFNHSYYLYAALVDVGPFRGLGQHLGNGLLFLALGLRGLASTVRLVTPGARARASDLVWAAVLASALDQIGFIDLASPAADGALWSMNALLAAEGAAALLDGGLAVREGTVRFALFGAAVAVTVKALAVFVALPLVIFLSAVWAWPQVRSRFGPLLRWAAFSGTVADLPWMLRGLRLSGYPLYPSTLLDLHLPWRVPEAESRHELLYDRAFARFQSTVDFAHRSAYPWVRHWLAIEWLDDRVFLIPALAIALGLVTLAIAAAKTRRLPPAWPCLLPSLAAVVFWWAVAPDPRFATPLQWVLAAEILALVGFYARADVGRKLLWGFLAVPAVAGALVAARPDVPLDRFAPLPREHFEPATLASGEAVHRYLGCCLEVPCSDHPERLRLRRPGDWSGGLTSDRVAPPAAADR